MGMLAEPQEPAQEAQWHYPVKAFQTIWFMIDHEEAKRRRVAPILEKCLAVGQLEMQPSVDRALQRSQELSRLYPQVLELDVGLEVELAEPVELEDQRCHSKNCYQPAACSHPQRPCKISMETRSKESRKCQCLKGYRPKK